MLPTHGPPTHPGEMLREEFLKPFRMSQTKLARRSGIDLRWLRRLLAGRESMTATVALRLARTLGNSAQFWMSLQSGHDLWHAAQAMRRPDRP